MYSSQTFEVIQSRILGRINNGLDKREGSFTYDMTAPNAIEISKAYMELNNILNVGFIVSTNYEMLDTRVNESGVIRKLGEKATGKVVLTGTAGTLVPNGTIFLCNGLSYVMLNDVVISDTEPNECFLECLEVGEKGNVKASSAFTLETPIDEVETITNEEDFVGGIDMESDDKLKSRYFDFVTNTPTSGNPAHYRQWALETNGVERALVYPRHAGAGTVKVVVIAKDNQPVSHEVLQACKSHIEESMPLSELVLTVSTPSLLGVNVQAQIVITEGYNKEEIKSELDALLYEYIATSVTDTLYYSKVYGLLTRIEGVEDVKNLTLNGASTNISITEENIVHIESITIEEVY